MLYSHKGKGMKKIEYTDVICKKHCQHYKNGKEEMMCGSFGFLEKHLSTSEIIALCSSSICEPDFSEDAAIKSMACEKCGFMADGCDYRGGVNTLPCGGYSLLEHMIKANGVVAARAA